LDTYELPTVWETPDLISSLYEYSLSQQPSDYDEHGETPRIHRPVPHPGSDIGERESSVLFLRITAAADYFTTNTSLMQNVPPVYVDIILDPFLFNLLPRSLAPTAVYILVVAAISYFAARHVVLPWLLETFVTTAADDGDQNSNKKNQ
jgi:hypothetical protein